MCEHCWRNPCHPRCPHAPDPPRVFVCSGCNGDIVEGDDYWEILGEQFCEKCIREARREAVYDPD